MYFLATGFTNVSLVVPFLQSEIQTYTKGYFSRTGLSCKTERDNYRCGGSCWLGYKRVCKTRSGNIRLVTFESGKYCVGILRLVVNKFQNVKLEEVGLANRNGFGKHKLPEMVSDFRTVC